MPGLKAQEEKPDWTRRISGPAENKHGLAVISKKYIGLHIPLSSLGLLWLKGPATNPGESKAQPNLGCDKDKQRS
jgi:hypothetical protein